ncbi:LTA synthase family protein [Virgibacillus pantothenticus]|uniref:LTA synthase family protein n=1 Tax=Virgibacillus pantothenticus TaxID=1473 RepID=UPI001C231F88|nr:LTA synthase family protein [Virgibacillus pantothenticus]MBU8566228.1 LTA synthase family protein [Virgibacillus pantothenticus]MBU8600653.1 LTA synthase family protein [Virgibacillus pantothenticus]MBU8634639.1 LTA synthase family protein [Virgibacillus pantothenticus]MBU8640758.1 LTA synthase family protein [Virgibacillus pantothenticus]MBU8646487.1 LTA synthase family protein [Virgibacillus pantothenticus]
MKKLISSKLGFFAVALVLFWVKTYLIYKYEFSLGVSGVMQEFLLFFNPLNSGLIFLGLALFAKGRKAGIWIIIIDTILSFVLYANVVFYRFNSDFITIPTMLQTDNFGSIGGSIADLAKWSDLLYAIDIIFLIGLFVFIRKNWSVQRIQLRKPFLVIAAGVLAFTINLGLAEADRPQLLERTFDRNYLVKYLGAFNFTIYDAVQSAKTSTRRVLADSSDITKVENYTKSKYAKPNEKYFGKGKGKNIIKIHLESFQSFLIDYKLHGEEVTPFLNSLVNDQEKGFTYFNNFFHQTEQGKTADAELILDTSLYGLPQGAAFVTKGNNTYQALPAILDQEQNYTSSVFHGDGKSFWNRDEVYKHLGINEFYHEDFYDMSEENVINYGLKDKPFFEQSMPYLEDMEQPFYAHMMTLTHHHPYLIDEEDATIDPAETGDGSVDRYFQTARYLDESLEEFFEDLKEKGLYEDSIIMIYGDHYGISDNHNRAMEEITGEEITPMKNADLQRVPFMIRIPGVESEGTKETYAGQIDVMPTLLHILGIDAKDYIQFGTDMFSEDHKEFVPFRNGNFMAPEFSYVDGKYYDSETKEVIEEPTDEMKEMHDTVMKELELSDEVLYGDLLRFYTPNEDWEPIDESKYFYGGPKNDPKTDTKAEEE